MIVNAISNKGLVREKNEDSFWVDLEKKVFIVADGMGGHKSGEVASKLAIDSLKDFFLKEKAVFSYPLFLNNIIEKTNTNIYEQAKEDEAYSDMGTTLSLIVVEDQKAYLAHIGDSRIYLLRDKKIKQLTDDHSLVGELVRTGEITPEMARKHPHKNVLTRALGTEEKVKVDIKDYDLKVRDILILCTDGLTNLVKEDEICFALEENSYDLEKTNASLVDLALKRGGNDNITIIMVHCNE